MNIIIFADVRGVKSADVRAATVLASVTTRSDCPGVVLLVSRYCRIFAPGELFMMSHGAGNFMRASLLLLHIVCGGFEWLECPRGWGFENRNLQIPTFAPSVPALGGRDWSGRPLIGA